MFCRQLAFALLLGLLLVTGLSGFRARTGLFDKLKGTWQVAEVAYTLAKGDSVVKAPTAQFTFAPNATDPAGQYDGSYQMGGKTRFPFLYQLDSPQPSAGELIIAVISPSEQPFNRQAFFGNQPDLSAIWAVKELPNGMLQLTGEAALRRSGPKEETVPMTILLKR